MKRGVFKKENIISQVCDSGDREFSRPKYSDTGYQFDFKEIMSGKREMNKMKDTDRENNKTKEYLKETSVSLEIDLSPSLYLESTIDDFNGNFTVANILAVDNEEKYLDRFKYFLRYHYITTEHSAVKASKLIETREFNIFIIDYIMPGLNGLELLREIKKCYAGKNYISIFCAAAGTTCLFKREKSEGLFHYFLEKPFTECALQEVINAAAADLAIKVGEEGV